MQHPQRLRRPLPLREHNQPLEQRRLRRGLQHRERTRKRGKNRTAPDQRINQKWKSEPKRFRIHEIQRLRDNPVSFLNKQLCHYFRSAMFPVALLPCSNSP